MLIIVSCVIIKFIYCLFKVIDLNFINNLKKIDFVVLLL